MNNNKKITDQYINDFIEQFGSSAEKLEKAIQLLLNNGIDQAKNLFEMEESIKYRKGDMVNQNYKKHGKLIQNKEDLKSVKPNVDERHKFIVFRKNYYQCAYTGIKLINHPLIELLSYILPNHFPYDNPPHGSDIGIKNTHLLVWALWPSVDHIIPVSLGGKNEMQNYTTSNNKFNMFKGSMLNENLGIEFIAPTSKTWNGLEEEYHLLFEKYKSSIPSQKLSKFIKWNNYMTI